MTIIVSDKVVRAFIKLPSVWSVLEAVQQCIDNPEGATFVDRAIAGRVVATINKLDGYHAKCNGGRMKRQQVIVTRTIAKQSA